MKVEVVKSNLKYPLYACKFISDDLLLVTGGGGEGNNGIDNKITLLSIDNNKIKKFRELKLNDDNDSPTCMDFIHLSPNVQDSLPNSILLGSDDIQDNIKVDGIFLLGCNENSNKILQSNVNNSLQRFNFENQHIRFIASVDYDLDDQSPRDLNTYMKFLKISDNIEFAACCTSKVPSIIRIINPITLNELYEIETGNELRDFDFQKGKQAKILSYITKNTCELISCVTGTFITKSYQFDVNKFTPLKLKFIREDCFFIILKNDTSNKFELHLFSITGEIKLLKVHELKNLNFKGITSVDYSYATDILAISGNDNSVNFFHLFYKQSNAANHSSIIPSLANSKLKYLKKFSDLHTFAITKIAFNDSGSRLSTVSADNSVSIINIPKNFKNHKPTTKKVLSFFFKLILLAILCVAGKFTYENDLHIYARDVLLEFNNEKFQPLLKNKIIPFIKEKINKDKNKDSEYFKFKENQYNDEYDQVTILSKDVVETTTTKPLSYSTTSSEKSYTTSQLPHQEYYEQEVEPVEDDDEEAIFYEDYLLSLNDLVSVEVTTPGYESEITSVVVTQSTAAVPVQEVEVVVDEEHESVEEVVEEEPEVVQEIVEEEPEVIEEGPEVIDEEPEFIEEVAEEESEIVEEEPEITKEEPETIEEESEVIEEEPETIEEVSEEPEIIEEVVEEPELADEEPEIVEEETEVVEKEPEFIDEVTEVEPEVIEDVVDEPQPEATVEIIDETEAPAEEDEIVAEEVITPPPTESLDEFKIQTVPNVEEDVESILKANPKFISVPSPTASEPEVQIQTVPNVEEDIEEILIVATETSTTSYATASATETPLKIQTVPNVEEDVEAILKNNEKDSITEYEEDEHLQEPIQTTVGESEILPTETPDKDTYDHDRALRIEAMLPDEVDVHLPQDVEEHEAAEELLEVENDPESKTSMVSDIAETILEETEVTPPSEESVPTEDPEVVEQDIEEAMEKLDDVKEHMEKEIEEIKEHEKISKETRGNVINNTKERVGEEDLNESLDALYEKNEQIEEDLALDEL